MRVRYWSDLHLDWNEEFISRVADLEPQYEVLVLAGDIAERVGLLGQLFAECCFKFKHVFYVAGNHDRYLHGSLIELLRLTEDNLSNFTWLRVGNSRIFDGVLFVGDTLWTDYNKRNILAMQAHLKGDSQRLGKSVTDIYYEHLEHKAFIFKTLLAKPHIPAVAVGHHGWTTQSIHERYVAAGDQNYSFVSDLSEDILDVCDYRTKRLYLIHGHVHNAFAYDVGPYAKVYCNPSGYPSELGLNGFDFDASFEIDFGDKECSY